MRLRNVIWILLFLSLIIVIINFASSLMYDCKFVQSNQCVSGASQNYQYPILKAFAQTNAHGAIASDPNYPWSVCCNFTGNGTCTGQNTILKLSGSTNAHAEISTLSNYPTNVCYTNLSCIATASTCDNAHPIKVISLASSTNAHIEDYNLGNYNTNICCNNSAEPAATQTCAQAGGHLCISPAVCTDGTYSPVSDPFGTCCKINCCTPTQTCNSLGYQCGSFTNNCGQTVVCSGCGTGYSCDGSHHCALNCVPEPQTTTCGSSVCGTKTNNCGQTVSCGNCDPSTEDCVIGSGSSPNTCVPKIQTCDITSAYWSESNVSQYDIVKLITKSNLVCAGQNISFEIKEYDQGFLNPDDPVTTNPSEATINASGDAIVTWTAEWQNDSDGDGEPPEYYFNAQISSAGASRQSSDPKLQVFYNAANPNSCNIQTCFDYHDSVSCNTNKCQTSSNNIIDRTANMIQGQSCGIQECSAHGTWLNNCGCVWNQTGGSSGTGSCGFASDWNSCSGDASCGDNIRNICEACDGTDLSKPNGNGTWSCTDFGFSGGTLKCDANSCDKFDFSSCTGFLPNNDGKVNFGNETCDSTNLTRPGGGIWSCANSGVDEYDGGVLNCNNGALDFSLCTCTLSPSFKIGTCSVLTGNIKECNQPPEGFLTIPWNGLWSWGHPGWATKQLCEQNMGVGTCIQDAGNWYHDPESKKSSCITGGISTIECPTELRLPFLGTIGLIIVALIITMIYLLHNKRFKKVL